MTSEERKEKRYQRRKAKRLSNLRARNDSIGGLADVFTFRNMFQNGKRCCNNVRWKQSTQNFERHLLSNTAHTRRFILSGIYKPMKCAHFKICERGKVRQIDAPHITDRQVQKTLTKSVIVPLYEPSMISDNAASQKGKGLHYAFRKLKEQLRRHYSLYGREGAALLIDLRGFFPNAPRMRVYERHRRYITHNDLRSFTDYIISTAPSENLKLNRGLPLGIELSQQEMVALPSAIDNWLKCQCGIKCCGHYMDDYYVILPDIEKLKIIGRELIKKFRDFGMPVNTKKCKIIPLTKPFKFCKAKFTIHAGGRVTVNGNRDGMKRARRKLKMFKREMLSGKRCFQDAYEYIVSQRAYYQNYDDHGRILRLNRLFYALFIENGGIKCT